MKKKCISRRTKMKLRQVRALLILAAIIFTIAKVVVKDNDEVDSSYIITHVTTEEVKVFNEINEEVNVEVNVEVEVADVLTAQEEEDITWLAMIAYTEINYEYDKINKEWKEASDESVLHVMASIYNRTKSDFYPDTVKEVVIQGNGRQYNGYKSKEFGTLTDRMITLATEVVKGNFCIDSNIMWYFNPAYSTDVSFVESMMQYKVHEVGGHVFCNNDGRL